MIYRIAEMLEGRRTGIRRTDHDRTGAQPRSPALMRILRSIGWCITRAGQTSWRLCWAAPIRCRAPLLLLAPEPTGVVGILRYPDRRCSLDLGDRAGDHYGNACVVIAAEQDPCVAITVAEVIATSRTYRQE